MIKRGVIREKGKENAFALFLNGNLDQFFVET